MLTNEKDARGFLESIGAAHLTGSARVGFYICGDAQLKIGLESVISDGSGSAATHRVREALQALETVKTILYRPESDGAALSRKQRADLVKVCDHFDAAVRCVEEMRAELGCGNIVVYTDGDQLHPKFHPELIIQEDWLYLKVGPKGRNIRIRFHGGLEWVRDRDKLRSEVGWAVSKICNDVHRKCHALVDKFNDVLRFNRHERIQLHD